MIDFDDFEGFGRIEYDTELPHDSYGPSKTPIGKEIKQHMETYQFNIRAATVRELIEKLQTMPQNLPVYIRPKYHGDLAWHEDVEVTVNGVAEMHPQNGPTNVTLLV